MHRKLIGESTGMLFSSPVRYVFNAIICRRMPHSFFFPGGSATVGFDSLDAYPDRLLLLEPAVFGLFVAF
jgi:hypothetical protein